MVILKSMSSQGYKGGKMKKLLIGLALFVIAISLPNAQGAIEAVYSDLFFNIGAVDEMTVTLLGESSVTSSALPGTATPANIEFNVSGDVIWQNASVQGGGSTQDQTNPIFSIDNTGTTNFELNISLNATMPSGTCTMLLRQITDPAPYDITSVGPDPDGEDVNTTNVTIDSSFTPPEATWGIWLYTNFSGCLDADDDARRFTIYAGF